MQLDTVCNRYHVINMQRICKLIRLYGKLVQVDSQVVVLLFPQWPARVMRQNVSFQDMISFDRSQLPPVLAVPVSLTLITLRIPVRGCFRKLAELCHSPDFKSFGLGCNVRGTMSV